MHDIDLVFDASPLRDDEQRMKSVSVLKRGGILVSTNVDFPFSKAVLDALAQKGAKGELVAAQMNHQAWLKETAQLIDDG